MDIQQVFAAQLKKNPPCSGDYMEGRDRQALFEQWLPFLRGSDIREKTRDFDAVLQQKIDEWAAHAGERMVYFIKKKDDCLEVMKIWESDIPAICAEYEFVRFADGATTMPVLQPL